MAGNIDAKQFRQALGSFTTGVTIVTTVDGEGRDVGMTANSFNSVSLDPPMVLWSIARSSTNFDAFMNAQHFAVHILANDQDQLASHFAKRGVDRFAGLQLGRGPGGIPLLEDCSARFQCRMAFRHDGGDHVILVGEVLAFDHGDHDPLVFKGGRYAVALPKAEEARSEAATGLDTSAPDFLLHQLGRAYHQLFARLQPELEKRRLGMSTYYALSLLGERDNRTLSELDALASASGVNITGLAARQLVLKGFITASADSDPRLTLTAEGQREVIELMAIAKAASDAAACSLDGSEMRLFRQFLNRVIAATDAKGE